MVIAILNTAEQLLSGIQSIYKFWGESGLYGFITSLTFLGREKKIRQYSVNQLGFGKGDKVLDIACGTGRNIPYLVEAVGKTGKVIGLDYSPEMLEQARKQAESNDWYNVLLQEGDAAQMEFPEDSLDGVISVLGMSVIPEYQEAMDRAMSALKPGKKLVICGGAPFRGKWQWLNRVVLPVYRKYACWDPDRDIPGILRKYTPAIEMKKFNGGSIYVVSGIKMF